MMTDEVAIPAGMKPWAGGDTAPEDWDGGDVRLRDGRSFTVKQAGPRGIIWRSPFGVEADGDVVAYTPMTPEPAQPAEAWLNDPASLESGEPAQPAESPEARALCSKAVAAAIKATEYKYFGDYEMSNDQREAVDVLVEVARRHFAATTARPIERGAVEEEAEAAYRAAWVQSSVDAVFRGTVDEGWRDWWHYRSWVTSQSDNPPVGQPSEAERLRAALTAAKQAARYVASGDGAYDPYASHVEAVDAIVDAALATQTATGRDEAVEWLRDAVQRRIAGLFQGEPRDHATVTVNLCDLAAALGFQVATERSDCHEAHQHSERLTPPTGRTMGGEVEAADIAEIHEIVTAWRSSIGNPATWLPRLRAALQNGGE